MESGELRRYAPADEGEREAESDLELTDLGNAGRLIAAHGGDLRFCHPWSRWLAWDGSRWLVDDTGEAIRRAKGTIQALLAQAAQVQDDEARKRLAAHALRSQSERALRAALALAQSEPGIPILPDQLDVDPWLLTLANGTVDLRTGELREHDRAQLGTKLAPVEYQDDVARLRGARFVAAVETGEGRRLNETLVKRLTGGDTIAARFMRGEWFEFRPVFKAWVATNHKPDVRGTDEAIWRRVRLIPFSVTIPEDERDAELPDGAAYRLLDRGPRVGAAHTYRLQAVRADGTRGWVARADAKR